MRRFAPIDLIDNACPLVARIFLFFLIKKPRSSHKVKSTIEINLILSVLFCQSRKKNEKLHFPNFRKAFPKDQSVFSKRALILATAKASANRNSTQNFLNAVESWVTTANLDSLVKNNSASTIYMTPVRSINSNSWRGSPVSITKVRKSESSNGTPIQKSACRL